MTTADRKSEWLAKAEEAERQAAKATEARVKEVLLKLAATYREMARSDSTGSS